MLIFNTNFGYYKANEINTVTVAKIRVAFSTHMYFIIIGYRKYNIVYSKGRKRWIMKKISEDKIIHTLIPFWMMSFNCGTHLHSKLNIHNFELPDSIPKTLQSKRPPKQQVIDAYITRFTKHPQNN